jgi:DNA-binding transcriptional ArsR family regulator
MVGQRRIPGLKLHDDRLIRVLETLLHPGAFAADWTTRDLRTRILARHHLAADEYRLSQLRYDLSKLRAKGLIERLGTSRRYRLTAVGLKLGVLLVKLRTRLLGPLVTLVTHSTPTRPSPRHSSSVEAAFTEIDAALDHLSAALGLQHTA